MTLRKQFLTNNNCYKTGSKMNPVGIMFHSTGADNPSLKRYVNPDDGLLGKNTGGNHWNQAKPDGRSVCVHAFIGLLSDGKTVATYQTLPWDMRGWHSGGDANNGYIGFEVCEDGLTDKVYALKVYSEAVELCAMLCKEYSIKPESPYLICHSEGFKLGLASNHSDVMHWLPKFGKSMDSFRSDVKGLLNGFAVSGIPTVARMKEEGITFDENLWTAVFSERQAVPMEFVPALINKVIAACYNKPGTVLTAEKLRTAIDALLPSRKGNA